MKIDEACIDYNVSRLTKEISISLDEFDGEQRSLALAEIAGIYILAEALKEVLKS